MGLSRIAGVEKELARVKEEQRSAAEVVFATHMAADALLVAMALQFGRDVDGGRELTLDGYDAGDIMERYEVMTTQAQGAFVVRIATSLRASQ